MHTAEQFGIYAGVTEELEAGFAFLTTCTRILEDSKSIPLGDTDPEFARLEGIRNGPGRE